jgi:hypothetical protein
MVFNLSIDAKDNPNLVGEHLRHLFFDQNRIGPDYTLGCYSTFKLRENVVELPKQPVPEWDINFGDGAKLKCDETCENSFACAELETLGGKIKMLYHWSHDGFLSFVLPDGSCLYNSDCKKDYCWKLVDSFEEYWHTSASL